MRKKTGFMAGMVAMLLIVGLIGSAAAVNATVSKNLTYKNIKIVLNGKELIPKDAKGNVVEPFVIDGTTYLPVRAIGEALGLDVGWDGNTSTVILTEPKKEAVSKVVYEDEYVTIAFNGCADKSAGNWLVEAGIYEFYSEAKFLITNKTDEELTFQPSAISFDGISYQFSGSEEVAANSTGNVTFHTTEASISVGGYTTMSGKISVIDWNDNGGPVPGYSYDAAWTNVNVA